MASAVNVPYITVQHDAEEVEQDVLSGLLPRDRFWISVYATGRPSVHGHVIVTSPTDGDLEYEVSPGLEVERVSNVSAL